MWSQQVYNHNIKDLRCSWEEGHWVHCRVVVLIQTPSLSLSGGSPFVTIVACQIPHRLSTLNTILPHNLLVQSAPLGLWQCLPAQLLSISTEISNNVCWLAVCSSGVVSYGCRHVSPQRSSRCSKLTVVLLRSRGRFSLIHLLNNSFAFALTCFICTIWWNTKEICKLKWE